MSEIDRAPAVSVVIPCYNGGQYLDRVLASLAGQRFRDFETIIVDDGSADAATVEKLASLPASVRVIRQENCGLSGARNTGFRAAKAELVLPLDCDDEIEPSFLATTVSVMRAAPANAGVVFTHIRLSGAAHGELERHFHPFDLLFANGIPSCALIRKSAWSAIGGYDEAMREGYEDWEFFLRMALHGYDGVEIAQPLFVYNMASGGMLLGRSSPAHVRLWRYMRQKHRDAYRLSSILTLWRRTRGRPGKVSLAKGLLALALSKVLPDALYGRLVAARRSRRFMRPTGGAEPKNAVSARS
ncbi:MAG: glycosyltransferase family 2 protein [Bradyrhizobiaceae bacterium]|nr:glycosyltransferase family 2 protein [Bradyrhizobiaceae bacterium]